MIDWLRTHKFKAHLAAFLTMLGASFILLILANTGAAAPFLWGVIILFGAANLFTIFIP